MNADPISLLIEEQVKEHVSGLMEMIINQAKDAMLTEVVAVLGEQHRDLESMRDELVSPAEVAQRLSVNRRTIYRWIDSKRLPTPIRLPGGKILFRWREVLKYLGADRPADGAA